LIPTIAKSKYLLSIATNLLRPLLIRLKKQQQGITRRPHTEANSLTEQRRQKETQHTKRTPQNSPSAFSAPKNTQNSNSGEFLVTGKVAGDKNFGRRFIGGSRKDR